MKVAGILQPGTTLGYVVEGRHVRGTLIVCQTLAERDALLDSGVLVDGTPIYVADTGNSYRYIEEKKFFSRELSFALDENGVLCTKGEDGSLEKLKLDVTLDDLAPELKEELENVPTLDEVEQTVDEKLSGYVTEDSISSIREDIATIHEELEQKQTKLTAGKNITISDDGVISADYEASNQLSFSDKAKFPYQGEEGILYIATDEAKIYYWSSFVSDYVVLSGESALDVDVINGGNAL